MGSSREQNKQSAQGFYDLMFDECRPAQAIERYAGAEYIQHNPASVTASRRSSTISNGWRSSIQVSGSSSSGCIAEDDYVVLHCFQHWPGDHD